MVKESNMEEKVLAQGYNDYAQQLKSVAGKVLAATFAALVVLLIFFNSNDYTPIFIIGLMVFFAALCLFIFALIISKTSITVTNKRVRGSTMFREFIDLPLDSISAVGVSAFKGIAISTSSGKISFRGIDNRDKIHRVISEQLVERQNKGRYATIVQQEAPQSNAEELKKFKELLDSGIITQEEFDKKKKQLLDL